ncbi:MAG: Lipoprotein-releasing system ATP-binding protein LolD [candidate division BRC1 bacterium ADurb.BinA364]|nr:MAG: Lipoprotein-releasing system ATP-binding protein LolD [candidate division BRC1 bacterium ADurb.BinA364]
MSYNALSIGASNPLGGLPGSDGLWPERASGAAPLYELRNVSKSYIDLSSKAEISVLQNLSLSIPDRRMTAIIGPSGAGKSTLLHLLGGLDVCDEGTILFRGKKLPKQQREWRALNERRPAFIFQDLNLVSHLSALDNAALLLICQGSSQAEARRIAWENLDFLDLRNEAGRLPAQMSGEQKRRVAIARALSSGASVILADEPAESLDSKSARAVLRYLSRLPVERQLAVILTTRNVPLAFEYCPTVYDMDGAGFKTAAAG